MGSFAAENIDRGQMDLQARCATRATGMQMGDNLGLETKTKTKHGQIKR